MADYSPVYSGGVTPFTATTSAAVTGGRVLAVSGDGTVAHAAAGSVVAIGVAAHDAASGARVSVWPLANAVHEINSPAIVTQGTGVKTAAAGEVATEGVAVGAAAGTLIGIATTTSAAAGKVRFVGRG
jgi:hypothetical protein